MKQYCIALMAGLAFAFAFETAMSGAPLQLGTTEIPYGVGEKPWDLTLGQHRARVHVDIGAAAVRVHLPWRLQLSQMDSHNIVVVDTATEKRVQNVVRVAADRMAGEIVFQPATVPGDYYIYYLPLRPHGNLNDASGYVPYRCDAETIWLEQNRLKSENAWRNLPAATVLDFQARTEFDRFDPMEVIASASETKELLAHNPQPLLLFPEDRLYPIRMQQDLPVRWIKSGPKSEFAGTAQRNEYYAFQIGTFAPNHTANRITVSFSALRGEHGGEIPESALTCFNTEGVDTWGRPFSKTVNVPAGRVQPLWIGVDVARDQAPGVYTGTVTVQTDGITPQTVTVHLTVLKEIIDDRGDNEPWRHSRLRWLNSTAGIGDFIVPPYTPLTVTGQRIACLGREVELAADGLPASIVSGRHDVLAAPVRLAVESQTGSVTFTGGQTKWTRRTGARVEWEVQSAAADDKLICRGWMEYDGTLNFRVTLRAGTNLDLRDIRLELPFRPESAEYMMGAGRGGGFRPKEYQWKWSGPFDSFWIGSVPAGLHCELRGGSYNGPMLNIYRPAPPPTWGNDGKGGVSIREDSGRVLATAFSGERHLKAGEEITFEFALLITPVKPLDVMTHLRTRYYHRGDNWTPAGGDPTPPPDALAAGVNVVNVHHASIFNPYINYPFLKNAELSKFTTEMHGKGVKVKVYDTVRELSNMVTELWALRSLGNEVIANGGGGGYAWCQEHMLTGYAPAWFQRFSDGPPDAAFVTSGESRWYNYYIEGIGWLVRHTDIDGLYLDDVTYDRHILQRVRAVMSHAKHGCLIDLHSNTGFSIGPANQYTEFFPYLDRLWFGESFNYNAMTPDQWLVEVSGIPFGLMGEMLNGGGNQWLGPVYGMTVRLGWPTGSVRCDPRPVWRVFDRFGIAEAKMFGYWEPNCPVRTDSKDVLATAYVRKGRTLIAMASWVRAKTDVRLTIDWKTLGLDPAKTVLYAPASAGFQPFRQWKPTDPIPVDPLRGWLLIADETGPTAADTAALDDTRLDAAARCPTGTPVE